LADAANSPKSVFGGVVADGNVAALFKPMRDDAPVFAIVFGCSISERGGLWWRRFGVEVCQVELSVVAHRTECHP
jgi:hypothetical protein